MSYGITIKIERYLLIVSNINVLVINIHTMNTNIIFFYIRFTDNADFGYSFCSYHSYNEIKKTPCVQLGIGSDLQFARDALAAFSCMFFPCEKRKKHLCLYVDWTLFSVMRCICRRECRKVFLIWSVHEVHMSEYFLIFFFYFIMIFELSS